MWRYLGLCVLMLFALQARYVGALAEEIPQGEAGDFVMKSDFYKNVKSMQGIGRDARSVLYDQYGLTGKPEPAKVTPIKPKTVSDLLGIDSLEVEGGDDFPYNLIHTDRELALLEEAMRAAKAGTVIDKFRVTKEPEQQAETQGMEISVTEEKLPIVRIDFSAYSSASNWIVIVNGKRITPDNFDNSLFSVISVSTKSVKVRLHVSQNKNLYHKMYQALKNGAEPGTDVVVDQNNDITLNLSVGECFYIEDLMISDECGFN